MRCQHRKSIVGMKYGGRSRSDCENRQYLCTTEAEHLNSKQINAEIILPGKRDIAKSTEDQRVWYTVHYAIMYARS